MIPVVPVCPSRSDLPVTKFGSDQPEYLELPCYKGESEEREIVVRWKLTWKERLTVFLGGSIWTTQLTFRQPLQPIKVDTECPPFLHLVGKIDSIEIEG